MLTRFRTASAVILIAGAVQAQSINVDVGESTARPPATYGAAGDQGFWNTVRAEHTTPFTPNATPDDYTLRDITGRPTSAGFHQFGGMDLQTAAGSDATSDDATLMNDYLVTHSISLESCMYLNGLQNGLYEVLTYAWFPNQPTVNQKVRFDFVPGSKLIGGNWPGGHAEGVTYSRDIIEITDGHIGWHVGIPAGGDTGIGAAFNGFQLHKVGQPGDSDDDGDVDLADHDRFSECMTGPNQSPNMPGCIESDIDSDQDIDLADMAQFQRLFTGQQ